MDNLFKLAKQCIAATNIEEKLELTRTTYAALIAGELEVESYAPPEPIGDPGRPEKPRLVSSRALPQRKMGSLTGRASMIHSFVHIEFNAINLAWDAVYRFRGLPSEYYTDWAHVAAEEATHFSLLRKYLSTLGYNYGDFDAHDGLWSVAKDTADDVLVRMAVVPRVLEARGLDVTPAIIRRFRDNGDEKAAQILEKILRDEIGHVEIGSRWYACFCLQRGLDRETTFERIINKHVRERIKGPLHVEARKKAGFNDKEINLLNQFISQR